MDSFEDSEALKSENEPFPHRPGQLILLNHRKSDLHHPDGGNHGQNFRTLKKRMLHETGEAMGKHPGCRMSLPGLKI